MNAPTPTVIDQPTKKKKKKTRRRIACESQGTERDWCEEQRPADRCKTDIGYDSGMKILQMMHGLCGDIIQYAQHTVSELVHARCEATKTHFYSNQSVCECELHSYRMGKIHCCYFWCCCHGNHPSVFGLCTECSNNNANNGEQQKSVCEEDSRKRLCVWVSSFFFRCYFHFRRKIKLVHEFVCWSRVPWTINRINLQSSVVTSRA